jgi:flagellar hook-associated protein 2
MPAVNFSGIASGIDTEGLIAATLDSARATKVTPSEKKKTDIEEQSDALNEFKTKLVALQSTVQAFRLINGGAVEKIATSSDDSVAVATASAGLSNGSYTLTVSQLAEPGRVVFPDATTGTYANTTTTLFSVATDPNDTITFTINHPDGSTPTPVTLDVTTSTTAAQFVAALNENSTFASYAEASLINVGSASTPAYKIVVTSKDTGAGDGGNAINFTSTATLALGAPDIADGLNAEFTISGISTSTISRTSNEITDVISGLNISLKDTGTAKITIAVDTTATKTKIEDFIKAYNDVIAFMQESNNVERVEDGKEVTNVFGPLAKTTIDENFLQLIRTSISGAQSTSGTEIRIFADMGITTDSSSYNSATKTGGGTLALDSDSVSSTLGRTFAEALASEPDAVEEILQSFAETVGNPTTGVIAQFANFNRLIDTALNSNRTQISDLESRISDAEKQLSRQEELLRQRYARLESLIGGLQAKQNTLSSALAGL